MHTFLDSKKNGSILPYTIANVHNNGKVKERKRILVQLKAYFLTILQLRRNFDMNYLTFLYSVSEGIVSNSVLTW